jgi:hypothetical protein
VKELMGILKKSGYTNKEISTLLGEKWSDLQLNIHPRITVKDSTPKDNATKVIANMISKGLILSKLKWSHRFRNRPD